MWGGENGCYLKDSSMENFKLCQAKQGRPQELQRPAESKGAPELPGEDNRNTKVTLLLPSYLSDEPNWGFTSRSEEGLYQQAVSRGPTEEELEVTHEMATLWIPNVSSMGQPSSLLKPCSHI